MEDYLMGPVLVAPERLSGMRRGLEKESLRSESSGRLAMTPHPAALGSALTHPSITTDFSESQVELITGVHAEAQDCIAELTRIQQFTMRELGDEMLWVSSMPCGLPTDGEIPLGQYGNSNVGRAKTVYRSGLGYRYGRRMQTISGIHYNWSLPGVSSAAYFGLIRNFRRHAFLPLYLFGASPAVCSTFVAGRAAQRVHAQAGVVRDRGQPAGGCGVAGLGERVLDEGVVRLLGFRDAERALRDQLDRHRRQQRTEFLQLLGVVGRQHQAMSQARHRLSLRWAWPAPGAAARPDRGCPCRPARSACPSRRG